MNMKKASLVWLILLACVNIGQGSLSASQCDSPFSFERFEIISFSAYSIIAPNLGPSIFIQIYQESIWRYSTPAQNKKTENRHKRTRVSKIILVECIKNPNGLLFARKDCWSYCYGYIFLRSISCTLLRGPPTV